MTKLDDVEDRIKTHIKRAAARELRELAEDFAKKRAQLAKWPLVDLGHVDTVIKRLLDDHKDAIEGQNDIWEEYAIVVANRELKRCQREHRHVDYDELFNISIECGHWVMLAMMGQYRGATS